MSLDSVADDHSPSHVRGENKAVLEPGVIFVHLMDYVGCVL